MAGADAAGLRPLWSLVAAHPEVAGADALAASLLHNWYLAPSRGHAMRAVQADLARCAGGAGAGRVNIVASSGELFKADGEIVGARRQADWGRRYQLGAAFAPAGGAAGPASAASPAELRALEAGRDAEAVRLQEAVQSHAAARQALEAAAAEAEAARGWHTAALPSQAGQREAGRAAQRGSRLERQAQRLAGEVAEAQRGLRAARCER